MLEVIERFITISGEAPIIGQPVYLYRFSKCNLDCSYCDTPYKNEVNYRLEPDELIDDLKKKVKDYPFLKVLFTGGEPLLGCRQNELEHVMRRLMGTEFYIETNGTVKIVENLLENCHFVCDCKAPSAKVEAEFCYENLKVLRPEKDCIKIVAGREDFDWLTGQIKKIKATNCNLSIFISPKDGEKDFSIFADFIVKNKLPVSFSLQIHRIIWPDKIRGV